MPGSEVRAPRRRPVPRRPSTGAAPTRDPSPPAVCPNVASLLCGPGMGSAWALLCTVPGGYLGHSSHMHIVTKGRLGAGPHPARAWLTGEGRTEVSLEELFPALPRSPVAWRQKVLRPSWGTPAPLPSHPLFGTAQESGAMADLARGPVQRRSAWWGWPAASAKRQAQACNLATPFLPWVGRQRGSRLEWGFLVATSSTCKAQQDETLRGTWGARRGLRTGAPDTGALGVTQVGVLVLGRS